MKWYKKFLSRKFFVFIIGTVMLYLTKIDGWQWLALATLWIGGNSIDKLIALRRQGNEKAN